MPRRRTVFALLGLLLICVRAQAADKNFHWGVNGHPCLQEGYLAVPISTQIDLLAQLGAHWYRSDWPAETVERTPEVYDALIAEAARRKVHILPIIFPPLRCDNKQASPEQIRQTSFAFAKAIARRFRGRITHWELDNELDNFTIIGKGDKDRFGQVWSHDHPGGEKAEHFEEIRFRKAAAELRGLSEGIKAGDAHAKTIIDAGWLHYGFIERLLSEEKVAFDILSWHWYSDMGDITNVQGRFNLLEHLRGYGKPIWITEAGSRDGEHPQAQAEWLETAAEQFSRLPGVEGFFVYELLDEPYLQLSFSGDNPELHYGLVTLRKDPEGKWEVGTRKAGFFAFQKVIQSRRR